MAMDFSVAQSARCFSAAELETALRATREKTLTLLHAHVDALGADLTIPYSTELNPPRWGAGHVAWFQAYWTARNLQRHRGLECDPTHTRPAGHLSNEDALYDSSRVAQETRWDLPLLDLQSTLAYMQATFDDTLQLLADDAQHGRDLYFYRLVLFHEDMHAEATIYMAQALDIPLPAFSGLCQQEMPAAKTLRMPATTWQLGWSDPVAAAPAHYFVFDNELPAHPVQLEGFDIDSHPVSWRRFLPAVEAGAVAMPRYVRKHRGMWQACHFGKWGELNLDAPAVHISKDQADSWCGWAKRRLPTEAEWEYAACERPEFEWGLVWEWTSSRFAPFEGFVAHPYRDYSRFGFEGHRYVLKGASCATDARIAHPRYRNFFAPKRNNLHAGFRSCAL
jgi:formylglycine-generating enzyme required for sulfatase activity|tara:strand:+ start:199200 stop:200378 length:1179 start_codon:yes stop_codon:yes gene_type:complete